MLLDYLTISLAFSWLKIAISQHRGLAQYLRIFAVINLAEHLLTSLKTYSVLCDAAGDTADVCEDVL